MPVRENVDKVIEIKKINDILENNKKKGHDEKRMPKPVAYKQDSSGSSSERSSQESESSGTSNSIYDSQSSDDSSE
jgi:hypothetical protein